MSRYASLKVVADQVAYPEDVERPRTRGDCVDGPRPCPFVSCRHHLFLDVGLGGSLLVNGLTQDVEQMPETCALDVADQHAAGMSLDEVGQLVGLTRERIRQITNNALKRFGRRCPEEVR